MHPISYHLQHIQQRIVQICTQIHRLPKEIELLAVSKTFDMDLILQAVHAGQCLFGESYVTEAVSKIQHFQLQGHFLKWHMIGHIQSNKTKAIAEHFQWVHSIDRLKIAQRLSDQRPDALGKMQVCLEVNVSHQASKSGVKPEDVRALAAQVMQLPRLKLRGLMCIPEPTNTLQEQRQPFALLRELLEDLQKQGYPVDTLSMGMSDDMEAAIMEGATIVRVGRGIFGARDYGNTPIIEKT